MDFIKKILIILVIGLIQPVIFSQVLKVPDYNLETGLTLTTGRETPFWLLSNQYGLLTPNNFNGWLKVGISTPLSGSKKIDYNYCLEIVNRYSDKNELYIHQAYLRLKLYFINIQLGSIEEKFGNQDSSLSSGGLLWSGNARPMPKLSIIVPDYTDIPFTNGFIEFKGGISHGWFDNNEFVDNVWLHHKYLYFKLGGKLPVHFHTGIHHFAQWGGEQEDGKELPSNLDDFFKVFIAQNGGTDAPIYEEMNALGNHIGSYNFGVDVDLAKTQFGIYWQTFFEDISGTKFQNIKDGLWGISFHTKEKNKALNGFVYEFLNTTNQSGPYNVYWLLDSVKYRQPVPGSEFHSSEGNDSYFSNGIYLFGWTYHDMTIGTPFITSPAILKGDQPEYLLNSKITAHHFGFEGMLNEITYKFFYTYYLNFGTNNIPISPYMPQHSILIQAYLNNKLPWGLDLNLKGGIDIGEMYGNNFGIQVSLIKSGSF